MRTSLQRRRALRRGAAAVEFAVVAIPLFMFLFASIEFGRGMMAMQTLEEAARAGCRTAVLKGATTQQVEDEVAELLAVSGISNYTVSVDPPTLSSIVQFEPVTVTVTTTFDHISWLPSPSYLRDMALTASCTLPREGQVKN